MANRLINPKNMPAPKGKYSHGVQVDIGDSTMIFVTGQVALDVDGVVVGSNNITAQTEFVFEEIKTILKNANASLNDVVKANIYVTDMSSYSKVNIVRNRYFSENPPACTFFEVNKLVGDGCLIQIEAIAVTKK